MSKKHILVTGSNGFIGKNLVQHLSRYNDFEVITFNRTHSSEQLQAKINQADCIVHLAAVNRPEKESAFQTDNVELTRQICQFAGQTGKNIPIIFSSSTQVKELNFYASSKVSAETLLKEYKATTGSDVFNYRLPGVFGKWSKPNYNTVVATFCYNIFHDLPIQINNPDTELTLVYIDDVIHHFIEAISGNIDITDAKVEPEYKITLGELVSKIRSYKASRETLVTPHVGVGIDRALYATYLSFIPARDFCYTLTRHTDNRGDFSEILKTRESGQFSFFTASEGMTRGGHFHHTKNEKFLVVQGQARFRFKHLVNNDFHEVVTSGKALEVVETVPGWTHDITNVGTGELLVLLWSNEIFDPENPDTYNCPIE